MKQPVLFGSGGGAGEWSSVLVVTAPAGSRVTISGGGEVITIDGTGSSYAVPIHKKTTSYTITAVLDGMSSSATPITTTNTAGQLYYAEVKFGTINVTLGNDFIGSTISCTKSGTTISKTATSTSLTFRVNTTGTWTISGTIGTSAPYTVDANVTDLDTPVSAALYTIPDGKTVLPVNDIQTWLACAMIDKSYTTLAEVLADEDVLFKVLTDDNANKYLKRSTDWAKNESLVPVLTGDTPNAGCDPSPIQTYLGWKAFNGDNTSEGALVSQWGGVIWYKFDSNKNVQGFDIYLNDNNQGRGIKNVVQLVGSNDGSTWTPIGSSFTMSGSDVLDTFYVPNSDKYLYWGIQLVRSTTGNGVGNGLGYHIQFYSLEEGITENELAMQIIGADDFASDILLSDTTWREAIVESEYWESVISKLVPTLSSDTDDIIYSTIHTAEGSTTYNPYKAFDNDTSTTWCVANSEYTTSTGYIGYKLKSAKKIYRVGYCGHEVLGLLIQGSNDNGSTWDTLATETFTTPQTTYKIFDVYSVNAYSQYRIKSNGQSTYGSQYPGYFAANELQFYGREAGGVQTLLKAAGISRPYTTIDELLADHVTLQKVISSHDAIDYLVTAKSFIDAFTSDATAMRYIGKRNYAANTLLGDDEWNNGIAKSEYSVSVLPNTVPTMTSNTAPEGVASADSEHSSGNYSAWKAFNPSQTYGWHPSGVNVNKYIQYEFVNACKVRNVRLKVIQAAENTNHTSVIKLLGSNDNFVTPGVELQTLKNGWHNADFADWVYFPITSTVGLYKYYRVLFENENDYNYNNGIKVQFYGRTDVDETKIDIYSAASDNDIHYLDNTGNPITIAATDTDGHGTVARTNLPNGIYTLYSSVAKNPNDVTEDYFKTVKVENDTIEIMLMPDDALYWYGYESPDLEDTTTANGWSYSALTLTAPTHNTRNISLSGTSSTLRGVASKKPKKIDTVQCVVEGITAVDGTYGSVGIMSSKNFSTATYDDFNITSAGVQHLGKKITSIEEGYIKATSGKARNVTIHSLWGDTVGKTPTYLSAAYDTLYIKDGNTKIPIATTNGEGKSFDALLTPGTYEIYSSVAKDPDSVGLADDYHQTVIITAATQTVKLMPDNALCWYGYINDNCEIISTANGWTPQSNYSFVNPTIETGCILISAPNSQQECGIGSKDDVSAYSSFDAIIQGVTPNSGSYGYAQSLTAKDTNAGTAPYTNIVQSAITKYTQAMNSGTKYACVRAENSRSIRLYAMLLNS